MRVLIAGGGTAGHINPAIAIADKIKAELPDTQFLFVGALGKMEMELVPAAGYEIIGIDVRGFQRKINLKNIGRNISAAVKAVTCGKKCGEILDRFKPDLAIGTGGYACGPILRKAVKNGIPVLLHESNALPGVTIKMLASSAHAVMIAAEAARKHLPENAKTVLTGNPVRGEFLSVNKQTARQQLGLDSRPVVLSFGGSQGAQKINGAIAEIIARSAKSGKLQHIHAAGKNNYAQFVSHLQKLDVLPQTDGISVREYIDDMPRCMAAADLVVSRSGAMTIVELTAAGKPAILIPLPGAAENHQYHNAVALAERGAAICIEDSRCTVDTLGQAIDQMISQPQLLEKMAHNSRSAAISGADDKIFEVIIEVMEKMNIT